MSDSQPHGLQHAADFPVLHHLLELAQTHVCWVGDVMQPSHPLLSPFPPAFNLSQHQGPFQWVGSSHQVAEYWNFSLSIRTSKEYSGLISWLSKGLSRVFSSTTVRKHQFFCTQPSLWSNSYICTLSELSRCWAVFCRKKKRSQMEHPASVNTYVLIRSAS